ncbi:MAG: EAL domain-containing protein [Propionivibrio sp.]|nr:EAL domain-containing protein [Propionivibrio sp.]
MLTPSATRMTADSAVDKQVLGQLLLMQSVVASLPDDAIIPFVIEGLSDIPGVGLVEFHAEPSESPTPGCFRIASGSTILGELAFKVTYMGAFEPYVDHIRNFLFMLAIILDERRQRQLLQSREHELERQVEERSADLSKERDSAKRYLDIAGVMLMALDREGRIEMINKKGAQLLGKDESALLGMNWFENFVLEEQRSEIREVFGKLMAGDARLLAQYENRIVNASGQELTIAWNNTLIRDATGNITGTLSSAEDVTERRKAEERIQELAYFDQLTGLPNRTLLQDRLQQAIAVNSRTGFHGALLFIDLDNFKTLNDTLGHDKGDQLLQQVAARLALCVREGDTVARLGGDEFMVVLAGLSALENDAAAAVEMVAEKILTALTRVYTLGDIPHHCTASLGITLFKNDQSTVENLMKQADLAMYKSKTSGRNRARFFDPTLEFAVKERAALEDDLRHALGANQFLLHYQAQILEGGCISGAEVLVRWQHPQRGLVPPAEFIPLAEDTGLILPLGRWVLESACTQLALWSTRPAMAHLTVAVNVSARQFHADDFVDQVLAVLEKSGANPQLLKLELTESLLVSDVESIIEKMFLLKSRGVSFSLDDFGTGFSSLSYLKRLPLDQLKIDQSFVRDVLSDSNDAAIARTIVALSQSLGLGVIAEGVETEAQRDFLTASGCHAYQGYFFSHPLPLQGFENFMNRT